MADEWYKIDNTGKVFHALSNVENSFVFRVSLILNEEVDADILQEALDMVVDRFPTLAVQLRKGLFWDFLEKNRAKLSVQEESFYPCAPIDPKLNNGYLLRVIHFGRRVSLEVFHSLTDGTGAMEFLKTLVYQYLILEGKDVDTAGMVLLPREKPSSEEIEDSFEKYASESSRNLLKGSDGPASQISGTAMKTTGVHLINGVTDGAALNRYVKDKGYTLTAFLTSLLVKAIEDSGMTGQSGEQITIALPVNLRRHFPSTTLRNFFSVVNIGIEDTGQKSLEAIMQDVSEGLMEKTGKEALQADINRYHELQRGILTRMIPIFLKYPAMRFGFNHIGERTKTMTLTNMGNVRLPESMAQHIERMDIALYPTHKSPISCGIGTMNGRMTITFALAMEETDIVRGFFKELNRLTGFETEIYSNEWGKWNA